MFDELLNIQSSWEYFKNTDLPIICYGTGDGADKVFSEFERLGITASGVMASGRFVRERYFHGFKVKSSEDYENEFGEFCIALCFGSQLKEVIDSIKAISEKHKILVPSVPVYGENIFNKNFFSDHIDDIKKAYDLLSDEKSKNVYYNIIKFELCGDLNLLFDCESGKDEALSEILNLIVCRSYLDLGAYKGDTVEEFLKYNGGNYDRIIAVEPDKKNFAKLQLNTAGIKNITLLNVGIWSEKSAVSFNSAGGRNSSIKDGTENIINSESVDSILSKNGIDYIKADVEGVECEMLEGAKGTLKKFKPQLNLAAYHRSEDLFKLILKVNELNPEYKIYLRHHPHTLLWDTNLYCK